MEEQSEAVFANRDETIPLFAAPASSPKQSTREKLKSRLSDQGAEGVGSMSIQDRLFTRLLEQVVPAEDVANYGTESSPDKGITRPPFSLPVMTNNFRRFNARIGIAFVFQTRLIHLFGWKYPTQTLSFLAVYSFVCLNPYLLVVLPLAIALFFIMVPAFLARHPPPPSASTSSTAPYYSYQGPALAPARTIKPASETSKDFFRNMRDLQNSMADFSLAHDAIVSTVSPLTNFSDEKLSSTVFLLLTAMTASLFLTAHLLPWRAIFFIGGNGAIIAGHPSVEEFLTSLRQANDARDAKPPQKSAETQNLSLFNNALPFDKPHSLGAILDSVANISLDSSPEEREVEIFELQHRSLAPYETASEWETMLFSPAPYDPLSPSRIAGDRPRGCRFFEDVQPPAGWAWKGKKWELDLECREWVMERMVTGVGFEVPGGTSSGVLATSSNLDATVGGWVWDLPPEDDSKAITGTPGTIDEDDGVAPLAYGDLSESTTTTASTISTSSVKLPKPNPSISKAPGKGKSRSRDWEEKGAVNSNGMGEWRRRRWVRIVYRVSVPNVRNKD